MADKKKRRIDYYLPNFIRNFLKRTYDSILRIYWKTRYIKKAHMVTLGRHFRFSRGEPYKAVIGEGTNTDSYNIWNAKMGDIIVGKNCWIGLFNIFMGPLIIGDNVATGPHVKILGPRHAVTNYEWDKTKKTVIGNKVWISTDSIILFGVQIGDNAIIGPGSVVTKDVQEGAYVSGNPARDLTKLMPFMRKETNPKDNE